MERPEAYGLLLKEMNKLTELGADRLDELCATPVALDLKGASGSFYRLEMTLERLDGARFAIVGKIHDNNTHLFSILEERLEFEAKEKS